MSSEEILYTPNFSLQLHSSPSEGLGSAVADVDSESSFSSVGASRKRLNVNIS